ncbi:unnamed protein product [Toxocara canis]|uniref:Single-stranded DNA-binding protein n=1 Tax=Toxocara canis TaxID=6265 RepID=A0A183UR84_TOXCA|nr:unnamed protein product [Toxocara canis]
MQSSKLMEGEGAEQEIALDHYHHFPALDAGPGSIGSDDEMATRWQAAVNEAFLESRAKHFGQKSVPFTGSAFRNITFSGEASSRGSERVLTVQIDLKHYKQC